jgi:hypothetical protein
VRYRIGVIEPASSWEAVVFDLPGCVVQAGSRDELLELAPVAIADHVAWLRRGGIDVAADDAFDIDVAEAVRAAAQHAADGEFCFADDLAPLADHDLTVGLAMLEWSRRDLLGALRGVPDPILDWRPPLWAMARIDEWNPDVRTIREITREIAAAEGYYRTGLRDGPETGGPDAAAHDLAVQRERLIELLTSLDSDDRGRRFEPIRPWQTAPEHWTARKVIRRVISHERFHTAEIRQRLSWLLVGVPRFRTTQSPPP